MGKARDFLKMNEVASSAWDVYLKGKEIDTVFFDADMDADDVYKSLVNHDGYDPNIKVKKSRTLK